jgi:hypothetical protein
LDNTFDYFEYSGNELDEYLSREWIKSKAILWPGLGLNSNLEFSPPTIEGHAGDRLQFLQGKFTRFCPHE